MPDRWLMYPCPDYLPFHTGRASPRTPSRLRAHPPRAAPGPRSRPGARRTRSRASRPTRAGSAWWPPARAGRWRRSCRPARAPSSSAWPGSASRLTSPSSWPRSASIGSPVSASSIAMLRGSTRGSRSRPPPAATSERLTSGIPSRAPRGGDDQIAGQRDLESARHRESFDRRDQRLGRAALGDPGEAAVGGVGGLAGDERLQVHPGAEALAGAGQHADRQAVVAVELVERGGDPLRDRGVDRVALVGAVDRDQEDAPAALCEDGLLVHAANNFRSGSRSPRSTARSTSTHSISAARGEHARLRLDLLRRQHPAAAANAGSSRIRSR